MTKWPCLLKLEGDNELIYLSSEEQFVSECQSLILSDGDILIDIIGQSFSIRQINSESLQLVKLKYSYSTSEVTHLIQAHEFSKAEMCLTKIQFASISAAINSLSLNE